MTAANLLVCPTMEILDGFVLLKMKKTDFVIRPSQLPPEIGGIEMITSESNQTTTAKNDTRYT